METPPTPAEYEKQGKAAYQEGDYESAAQAFVSSAQAYTAAGDSPSAAVMMNNASVAYLKMGDAAAAFKAAEGTPDVFIQVGDQKRLAMALGNLAAAMDALKQYDLAVKTYETSAELLKKIGEDEMYAAVMQSLSTLHLSRGRQLESLASMQKAIGAKKHLTLKEQVLRKLIPIVFNLFGKRPLS